MTATTDPTPLTDAYHAVYDHKDTRPDATHARYIAYEAAAKIAELMRTLGFDPPNRHDGEGRTDGVAPPYLTLDEDDAVEVFSALSMAAQVTATVGYNTQSAHFQGLYGKLADQARK
jgi:hypothetical protein